MQRLRGALVRRNCSIGIRLHSSVSFQGIVLPEIRVPLICLSVIFHGGDVGLPILFLQDGQLFESDSEPVYQIVERRVGTATRKLPHHHLISRQGRYKQTVTVFPGREMGR